MRPWPPTGLARLALGLSLGLGALPAAGDVSQLDRGGVSLDLSQVDVLTVTGPDLLVNGDMEALDDDGTLRDWQPSSYVWLAVADPARQARIEERVAPLMQWLVQHEAPFTGRHAARLVIPQPAYDPSDPPGHEFCAMYHQRVILPPLAQPTRFVLSYHQRGESATGMPNCRAYVRLTFQDGEDPATASQTRVYAQTIFQPSADWRRGELTAVAPRSTRALDVRIALTGVGEVEFDQVALHQGDEEAGLSVRLMPWGLLDDQYHLSHGDMLTMVFGFRNGDDRALEAPRLVLQLPDFVTVHDVAPAVGALSAEPLADDTVEYRYDLTPVKGRIRGSDFAYPWNQWGGLCLFVSTTAPPLGEAHPARYWIEDGDHRSEPRSFDIKVGPGLPAVEPPRRFRSGAHPFLLWSASDETAVRGFADTFTTVGFNSVHAPPSAIGDELGRRSIERYWQPFANGYTMGDATPGAKPHSAVYRDIEGDPVWAAICPTEVYRRGPYFESAVVDDLLRRVLVRERRADQLMCNWEPFMYVGRGCFCDRCKEEFSAFSELAPDAVGAVWPRTVQAEHPEVLRRFRSWQHGQFVATLQETMAALGEEAGREMNFIPELHYVLLTEAWERSGDSGEFSPLEYLDKLPAVNAWGPYNWHVFGRGPYEYVRGLHLSVHTTAVEVREFLRRRLPPDRQPRLFAFPYGTYEGVIQPEAMSVEMITYFLNGYEGAFIYLFPGGYDARHWRAAAEANRQIAAVEELVRQGRRADRHTIEPLTPLPPPDPRFLQSGCMVPTNGERWAGLSLLQSWEYEQGDRRLFAVGNFWERGECFFRLRPQVAGPGRFVLRDPLTGRTYAGEGGRVAWTAAELQHGVLLHCGAMRYSFFILEPYEPGAAYENRLTPADMTAALHAHLHALHPARTARPRSRGSR